MDHPVVCINIDDAKAYEELAGKRLPTEAEWEYASRGGLVGQRFPWGNDENWQRDDPVGFPVLARDYANYDGTGGLDQWDNTTAPVGSFKPNGYGLYDLAGNAQEWCADWYDSNYYRDSPVNNPLGY